MNFSRFVSGVPHFNFLIEIFGVILPFGEPCTYGSSFNPLGFTVEGFIKIVLNFSSFVQKIPTKS